MAPKMNRAIALVCLAVTLAGFGWVYERVNTISKKMSALTEEVRLNSPVDLGNSRLDIRVFVIRSQLSQADHPVVFIGDSITEAALLPASICGRGVINAGIGGVSAPYYSSLVNKLFENTSISAAIVALGTNDAMPRNANFRSDYESLLNSLVSRTKKLVLVGLPPTEDGLLGSHIDAEQADLTNLTISQIAQERKLPFVDLRSVFQEGKATIDGIHLSAAGYHWWTPAIVKAASAALGCG
jgi:hypothetical protein